MRRTFSSSQLAKAETEGRSLAESSSSLWPGFNTYFTDNSHSLSTFCSHYRDNGGYPLVADRIIADVENVNICIGSLEKMGLSFHRAWSVRDYSGLEDLLNLPSLKRLLGVTQMQAYYTSEGRGHTNNRYVHSLFVAQQVHELVSIINKNAEKYDNLYKISSEDAQHCIIAALFHDHAHGPFSHIFERVYHAFSSSGFDHDEELTISLRENLSIGDTFKRLRIDLDKVIDILDKKSTSNDHLHYFVKVFSDRFAYMLADSFSSNFSSDSHDKLIDLLSIVKNSVCISKINDRPCLAYLPEGADRLSELFNYRKKVFTKYCLSPESGLVAAIIGRAIKKIAVRHNNPAKLAEEVSGMTDIEFIERLAKEVYSFPELKELFSRFKNENAPGVDTSFLKVFEVDFSSPRFNDRLTDSKFRRALRPFLREKFQLTDDEIYATFPLGDEKFRTSFFKYSPELKGVTPEELNYTIKDADKKFCIWVSKKHLNPESYKGGEALCLNSYARVAFVVDNFVSDYLRSQGTSA